MTKTNDQSLALRGLGRIVPLGIVFAFVVIILLMVSLGWGAVWMETLPVEMSDLGVLFSGLAFAAVFSALLVQWWQLRSTQAHLMESQFQLRMQTRAMQGQLLQPLVEARVSALEEALHGLVLTRGRGTRLTGSEALGHLMSGGAVKKLETDALLGVDRFESARTELGDLRRFLIPLLIPRNRRCDEEANPDVIDALLERVENTLGRIPSVPAEWRVSGLRRSLG